MPDKEKEFKIKVDRLSQILCETAKGLGNCPVVDFVHDLTNMVLFSEMNKELVAKRTDKVETRIENLCNELLSVSNEVRKLRKMITDHIDETGEV